MFRHINFGGHALRIAVGIMTLVLLMAGGVQALSGMNIPSHTDINNRFIIHRMDAGITSNQDLLQAKSIENAAVEMSAASIKDNETGGDCVSIGIWNPASRTCTLTTDLNKTIEIESNNITLDGNGHTITGGNSNFGIYLSERSGVMIKNINVMSFYYGIYLDHSNNNILRVNNVSNNSYGIYLYYSGNNTLFNNTMMENSYSFGLYGKSDSDFNNHIDYSNTVDGKPIFYIINAINTVYDSSTNAGFFYLISCQNVTIKDIELLKNDVGILFWNTTFSKIQNVTISNNSAGIVLLESGNNMLSGNNASNNSYGIYLKYSGNNTISYNNVNSNNEDGIYLEYSGNNTLTGNNANSNEFDGIYMYDSSNNMVSGNNVNSDGDDGIFLENSSNNTLIGNNAPNNVYGIYLYNSSNNILFNNIMMENSFNFGLWGYSESDFNNQIDYSNTVDGKPIYYVIKAYNTVYDPSANAGVFYCISCINVTIKDIQLSKNDVGILFWNTTFSKIQNVIVSKNYDGIDLLDSSSNMLIGNNANSNEYDGIYLYNSNNNTLNDNNPNSNIHNGIHLTHTSNNTLSGNNVISNEGDGIYMNESRNNALGDNNASYNIENGICLFYSNNNNIISNNMNSNEYGGIYMAYSSNNNLSWNNAIENKDIAGNGEGYGDGIGLYYSNNNNITDNNASYNHEAGIYLSYSSSNLIYNNHFNNTNNSGFSGSNINTWNTTMHPGINIIGGSYLGGNFWANPSGTGFSQTCADNNMDGISDSSYLLDSNNIDYLSLAYNSGNPGPTMVDSYLPHGATPAMWKAGVIRAMDDYFSEPPLLTKSQLLSVMDVYFS